MSKKTDLLFLNRFEELLDRLSEGLEKRDPSQIGLTKQMIDDWIDELEPKKFVPGTGAMSGE